MVRDRLSRNVGKEITTTRCIATQKIAVLVCFVAEAWNMIFVILSLIAKQERMLFVH